MTEQDQVLVELAPNGYTKAAQMVDDTLNNHPRRNFITGHGVELILRRVPALVIRSLINDKWGMPQVPIVESIIGPKKIKHREPNPNDPEYKAALELWTQEHEEKFLIYLFSAGVENEISDEDQNRLREFFPGGSASKLRYLWVLEQLGSEDEMGPLTEAIMGQTMVTEKGISAAESSFPSSS